MKESERRSSKTWPRLLGYLAVAIAPTLLTIAETSAQSPPSSYADPPYVLTGAISLPNNEKITSFDISFVDPVLNRYYLANRTSKAAIVVDTTTNLVVGNFKPGFAGAVGSPVNNDISGPDGILTVDHKEIWVGDAPSRVWVLDINTGAPIAGVTNPISTGSSPNRADEMCYDPVDKILAVVNNADDPPFITFISTTTKLVLGKVSFNGTVQNGTLVPKATNGAEQCQWNQRDGKIYVSLPEINGPGGNAAPGGVVVIDPLTRAVLRTMVVPLASCTGPQGLAIGPPPQIGLGCNLSGAVANNAIINELTGITGTVTATVIASFPNQGGGDMIWFNPGNNKYFFAARSAPGGEKLFIIDAGAGFAVQSPSTGTLSNAHSVAVDPVSNRAYVPTSSAATSSLCSSMGAVDANGCILVYSPASAPTSIFSAVTPNVRTTTINSAVTAFAIILNAGTVAATACSIAVPPGTPANFLYQTTSASNIPTGTANKPADIPAGGAQSFFFAVTPTQALSSDLPLAFNCTSSNPAPIFPGLNTFLVSAAATAIPDMLSIAKTATNDGNIVFPPAGQAGSSQQAMATAAINIGAAGTVTFTPTDTPFGQPLRVLPLLLSICQTDPNTGACLAAPTPSVTLTVAQNQTVTFTVFVTRTSTTIPYNPSYNRVFLIASQGATPLGPASTPVGEASAAVKLP